jgi:hypothetical protein
MKYLKSKWMIIGVLLVAIGALTAFKFESGKATQYFTEKVQKGDIQNVSALPVVSDLFIPRLVSKAALWVTARRDDDF